MHECCESLRLMLLAIACGYCSGCGDNLPRQPTYPVTGQVTLDGRPVPGATVVLHPIDNSNFHWLEVPQGTTDDNGVFSLFTYSSDDGAPQGEYRVGIAVMHIPEEEGDDQVRRLPRGMRIPIKYANAQTSGLTATVNASATALPPFALSNK